MRIMAARRTSRILLWCLAYFLWSGTCSGSAVLSGRVLDASGEKGMGRITLRAFAEGRSVAAETLTENDGSFVLADLPAGKYAVCVAEGSVHKGVCVTCVEVSEGGSAELQLRVGDSWVMGRADRREDMIRSFQAAGAWRMCRVRAVGQTFVACSEHILSASAQLAGVDGSPTYVRFSVHEGSPGGRQIGPSKAVAPAADACVVWVAGEAPVVPGSTYYLHIESLGGGHFLAACAHDSYGSGSAFMDGLAAADRDLTGAVAGATGWVDVGVFGAGDVKSDGSVDLKTGAEATGKLRGSAGGMERGAALFDRQGRLAGWTVTGPSGLYEFSGLHAGEYVMLLDGKIVPRVRVAPGRTTVVDQARAPRLDIEKEVWGPARVSFAQSFVATGTGVTGFSLWRASGNGRLRVSLYEDSPAGRLVAGPYETEKEMVWVCGESLPADEFVTVPGRRYAIELADAQGKAWNCSMPRKGNVYPGGIAYYDGIAHAESDLGLTLNEASPGLRCIARGAEDLHYIAEGPGSGTCRVAGQTFVATASNVVQAFANCGGWGGGVQEFVFSIHENGPGGRQVGPACQVKMVCNWGSDVVWFSDAIKLETGRRYYMQYRREDGEPFYSYLSKDTYPDGRAFRDGVMLEERFDQLCNVYGEDEVDSVVYPYDVRTVQVTADSAVIAWGTGNAGDSLVHFGKTSHLTEEAGSRAARTIDHRVALSNLSPGTVYLYRVSSDTYRQSARRGYSRVYRFMTLPGGDDLPCYAAAPASSMAEKDGDSAAMVNPGFEQGTTGWKRIARSGRDREGETFVARAEPFGKAGAGVDGYVPHSGKGFYGFSYYGLEDKTWKEPREDWKREMITQRVAVEQGRRYRLTAWLLTGDRGSGWGRDSRVRLAVDEADEGLLGDFDTADQANVTQWFATQHEWLPVQLEFTARSREVVVGAEFLQWWALEACHLYVDEFSIRAAD